MKHQIDLQPWVTPNFVIGVMPPRPRQDGFHEGPKWALSDVEPEVLAELCDTFRAEIFQKAGKADPAAEAATLCGLCKNPIIGTGSFSEGYGPVHVGCWHEIMNRYTR